jgi:ABC-2 type transport system ATP-binding protein
MSGAQARSRTAALLEQFRLHDRANAYPQQLSGGLAQRLQIARAIAHHPRVLFLDEPSAGLDPQSRIAMWDAVRALRVEDITVVMTTHYMEEADALCDRVAIIDHGKILVEDTPAALKASVGGDKLYDLRLGHAADREQLAQQLRELAGVTGVEPTENGLRVLAQTREGLLPQVITAANTHGLRDVTTAEPTLETVFIRLTGRDLRE